MSGQFYKALLLDGIIIFFAAASGYAYFHFLDGSISLIWSLIAVLVFALFANLGGILGGGWKRRLVVSLLAAVALVLPFYGASLWGVIAPSVGAIVLFSLWGDIAMHVRAKNALKFTFFAISRVKMGKLVTGITIAAVILYLPHWQGDIPFLSQDRFGTWYDRTVEFVRGPFVGDLELAGSVDDFAKSIARKELEKQEQFLALPPDVQDRTIEEAASQLIENTEERLGLSLGEDTQVSNAAYQYVIDKLNSFKTQLGNSFLAVWGIVIFFLVRGLGTIFAWIAIILSYLFYEIFAALGVVRLTGENAVKEIVEFT